ncbi:MAG: ABC transporter substrate-binding protein [Pseudomonadota bacterium]
MLKVISSAALALTATTALADGHLLVAPGEGQFNWQSYEDFAAAHDYTGQSLTMSSPWLGPDAAAAEAVLAYFAEATGANVTQAGSDSFEQQILIDTEARSAPNLAVFPQPGLACDLAARGFVAPLGDETASWMAENYAAGPSWVALGSCDGLDGFYNFAYGVNVKSLVWYVPENFEDAGYKIPESMEELKALTDQIVADGGTPWCIGVGSGGATGWPATDWVEDLMLRTQPPEVYDQWTKNEIPFDDPRVIAAIEEFGYFARNDDYVAGGAAAVASMDFRDSPDGMFASPPQCYMHRQASFIPAFFPEDVVVGEDADFFYFPSYEGLDLGKPVLGAGVLVGITDDSPAARGFIEFLKTPFAHEIWMSIETQAFLTPHLGVNPDLYHNDTLRGQGEILSNATTFRFDGSDLMPGGVGAGTFWTGMVDYLGGQSAQDVAAQIQNSWDNLK